MDITFDTSRYVGAMRSALAELGITIGAISFSEVTADATRMTLHITVDTKRMIAIEQAQPEVVRSEDGTWRWRRDPQEMWVGGYATAQDAAYAAITNGLRQ